MKQLVKAVLSVMEECKGIEKSMTVGNQYSNYKGVSDKDVKILIGGSMRKNGLIILPVEITPVTTTDSWDETNDYGTKRKQSVFTEVLVKYRLIHESGEEAELMGYGHGVDPQDKGAGKATTYALKYTLLYSFLVATGHIDDTDAIHSDSIEVPSKPKEEVKEEPKREDKKQPTPAQAKKKMIESLNKATSMESIDKLYKQVQSAMPKYKFNEKQTKEINDAYDAKKLEISKAK